MALLCKAATLKVAAGGISSDYDVKETLAYSPYLQLRKAIYLPTGDTRVIKIIDKRSLAPSALTNDHHLREVEVLNRLDSPSTLRLFELFEDKFRYYLALEDCHGKDLMQFITESEYLMHVKSIMRQLVTTFVYIHSKDVLLPGLNFEGIVINTVSEHVLVKITDFSSAVFMSDLGKFVVPKGAALCIAPEVMGGHCGVEADVWTCGVILHTLVFGRPPYALGTDTHRPVQISQFTMGSVAGMEPGLAEMMSGMLTVPVGSRWTMERVMNCRWMQDLNTQVQLPREQVQASIQEMRTFRSSYKLKDAIFTFLSFHMLSNTDSQSLQELFLTLDTNGDTKVSRSELLSYFTSNCIGGNPGHEVADLLSQIDTDGSGFIDYSEFVRASINRRKYASKEYLELAFRRFDVDGGGKINSKDLESLLGSSSPETKKYINDVIAEADFNQDGEIDFTEFMTVAMKKF